MPQKHDIGHQKRIKNALAVKLDRAAREARAERNTVKRQKREHPDWMSPITYHRKGRNAA